MLDPMHDSEEGAARPCPGSALVREVPASFPRCLARPGLREAIEVPRARAQHRAYVDALTRCGLEVTVIPADESQPDAPFIEDVAVILGPRLAILNRASTIARGGEAAMVRPWLEAWRTVHLMPPGATLDGGDVLRLGDVLYVGISERTNEAGAAFLERLAAIEHLSVAVVEVRGALHLKSVCTALPDGALLHAAGKIPREAFPDVEHVVAPEAGGANVLSLGDAVVVSAETPRTADALEARGHEVLTVELSEFRKANGGPTCLSLRFD